MNARATGVVIKDGEILVMRRIKNGEEYYVLPGGWPDESENIEQAAVRELKEECSIDAKIEKELFTVENWDRPHYFFLVREFAGHVALGGEEKEKMNESDQYYPEWKTKEEFSRLPVFYPEQAREKLLPFF